MQWYEILVAETNLWSSSSESIVLKYRISGKAKALNVTAGIIDLITIILALSGTQCLYFKQCSKKGSVPSTDQVSTAVAGFDNSRRSGQEGKERRESQHLRTAGSAGCHIIEIW